MQTWNIDGGKQDPLVIGKSKTHRCFNGEQISKLPLELVSNKKGLDNHRFTGKKRLHKFHATIKKQSRKVLLFPAKHYLTQTTTRLELNSKFL